MMDKVYVIAEIAQGFEGNPWLCKKFIDLAHRCGANAVKFQIFEATEICTENYTYFDLFKSLEFDKNEWEGLIDYAHSLGIDFISDLFGLNTLKWIANTKISGFKIHSTDVKNFELLKQIKATNKHVYLSCGGSELSEIKDALDILDKDKTILLTGFQAEPNELYDIELDKIQYLKDTFKLKVGYADHIDPSTETAIAVPAMAVIKGADIIEKHLTIERDELQIEDYISALNPGEFRRMVKLIRDVEQFAKTGNSYLLGEREKEYRYKMKKNVLAARDLLAGHILTDADLALLRTGTTINKDAFFDKEELIGKQLSRNMFKNEIINKSSIK